MLKANIQLRTKDNARQICLDWVCPVCGKKGSELPITEGETFVTVSCKAGKNGFHATCSVGFDPKLTKEEVDKKAIRIDLNSKLADAVRKAPSGTSVDYIWEEFCQIYNPPDWYEEELRTDVKK